MVDVVVKIRQATASDLDTVQYCAKRAYSKYINRMDRKPAPMVADFESHIKRNEVFVAMQEDLNVGYVVIYAKQDYIFLENIAVDPSHIGKGIGRQLFDFVEHTARGYGYKRIQLYTNAVMTENLLMYPKLGYKEFKRLQEDGYDRVFFRKFL